MSTHSLSFFQLRSFLAPTLVTALSAPLFQCPLSRRWRAQKPPHACSHLRATSLFALFLESWAGEEEKLVATLDIRCKPQTPVTFLYHGPSPGCATVTR